MYQSLKFGNELGEIEINKKPYLLQRIDGVSGLAAEQITQQSPGQDGNSNLDTYFKTRTIDLRCVITQGDCDYDALNAKKLEIQKIFNPKIESYIEYTNTTYTKRIKCNCITSPVFSQVDRYKNIQVFQVQIICNEPFWEDIEYSSELMSVSLPSLEFPIIFEDYIEFETEGNNRITIENLGHVATPVIIEFNGPAENPKIMNETTGEYIRIIKTLTSDQKLVINTDPNYLNVELEEGEVRTTAFEFLDLTSIFFLLGIGYNTISFTADVGTVTATVLVKWKDRFLGL